jgi:hypothetical protein
MIKDLIIYTPMYVTFFWAVVLLLTKKENNPAKFFLGFFMSVAFLVYLSHAVFFQQDLRTYQYLIQFMFFRHWLFIHYITGT